MRFFVSDDIPSEASYSRLLLRLNEITILEEVQEKLIIQAIEEGFILDDTVAIDATHFDARDHVPPKEEKPKPESKKSGHKSKEEREQYLKVQAEKEEKLPLYEKKIEAQLDVPLVELRAEVPQNPK